MKNFFNIFLFIVSLTTIFSGCDKSYEELETDPNRPVNVPASLILQGVLYDMYLNTGTAFSDEMRWNQYYCSNYNYYNTNEYSWTSMPDHYSTLKNVIRMEEEAKTAGAGDINPYSALGKFFKAFFYDQMSRRVGDLPLSEALKGNDNLKPKYDNQKDVYVQILNWLDESNSELTSLIEEGNKGLTGDFYFNGDISKWQKAVNALQLRILIALSKKEGNSDLNIKTRFANILSQPGKYPVMSGLEDNLEFISSQFNKYPSNPDNFGFDATRQNMAKTYVDELTKRLDPRVMVTCEPAGASLKSGKAPSDFSAYNGASSGEDLADMSFNAGVDNGTNYAPGIYSFQNRHRFYTNYEGQSTFILGYSEMCFNIAEGIHRGWASGDADAWYLKGIKASFDFYGIVDGENTMYYSSTGGRAGEDIKTYKITFNFDQYVNQPSVKYVSSNVGLENIIAQKYIAFFMNSGMEAYFNWRRTGFPNFLTGVGTGNSGRIATRWQYPYSERSTNTENYELSIGSQYGGIDDINMQVWMENN